MEIRRIKPEEKVLASLISTMVFLGEEGPEYRQRLESPLEHSEGYENIWAGFDEAGKMCSSMCVHDYTIRFDGHEVGMGGVGGVGTLPECRKGGYVRKIFEKALREMKEKDQIFSYLYPFSYAFYRKFGYELCNTHHRAKVPLTLFKDYAFPDHISVYQPGDDMTPFITVYETFSRHLNWSMVRDTALWERHLKHDPYRTRRYAYYHQDKDGRPDGYLMAKAEVNQGHEGNQYRLIEMAWTTTEGLHALLGFINGMSPQFSNCQWTAPSGFPFFALFSDCYSVNVSHPSSGMGRIVDVPRALSLLKAPEGEGRVSVQVEDAFLPFNSGTYAIEWEGGAVSVKATDKPADLETNVETLAQLVTGFMTPAEARYKKGVTVNGNESGLCALFPHKDIYMMEFF